MLSAIVTMASGVCVISMLQIQLLPGDYKPYCMLLYILDMHM